MMLRVLGLSVLVLLATPVIAAPKAVRWERLADCAAAYRANAGLSDPERAASMSAMISETADDYQAAAVKAHRGRDAKAAVAARVARQAAVFAGRPRSEVERFIDACPQP